MSWRRFDLNVKGVEGIQERTIGGGVVTLLSCVVVAFLLLSEFSVWWTVSVTHRMHVDTDPQDFPINVEVDVSFLHEACKGPQGDSAQEGHPGGALRGERLQTLRHGAGAEGGGRPVVRARRLAHGLLLLRLPQLQLVPCDQPPALRPADPRHGDAADRRQQDPQEELYAMPLLGKVFACCGGFADAFIVVVAVATYKYFVNIVPSRYVYLNGRSVTTFQYSVTEHETSSRGPNGQVSFPGVIFSYEFSPIAVEYIESKPSVLHFLTSTSAIVGGVFAVARMIDGAIYSVSKKID
ncbi:hypothetical protein ON010_g16819 [Phytophthora cinnamomi]|nr:hypothetical protein ON010_g16819 [Phytophthora cinnamomi]